MTRNRYRFPLLVVGLAFSLFEPARGQTLTQGALEVVIRDSAGNPVASPVVTLRDRVTGLSRPIPVGRSGRFTLPVVAPGEYDLLVESFGARPFLLERIGVRSGVMTRVTATVTPSQTVAPQREVQRYSGATGLGIQHFSTLELLRYPEPSRELSTIARLSTISNPQLDTEGLPGSLSGIRVDGVVIGTPVAPGRVTPASLLPLSAFRQAELVDLSADVEWGGTAAPVLSTRSVLATSRTQLAGFADYSNGPALSGTLSAPAFAGLQAGAALSGQLVPDTASYQLGFEFWSVESPLALARAADSVRLAITENGNGLGASERVAKSEGLSGFGHLDWRLGTVHTLSVTGAFTRAGAGPTLPLHRDAIGAQPELEGMDAFAFASLTSQLSATIGQEFRIGWDRSVRDHTGDVTNDFGAASTQIVRDAVSLGRDPLLTGRYQAQAVRVHETLHYWSGQHHLKAGFSADLASYEMTPASNRMASFWFGSAQDFSNEIGYAVSSTGAAVSSFSLPRYGLFAQDEWSFASRFRVLIGARFDVDVPPVEDLRADTTWFRLSGIRADTGLVRHGRVSPRVELEWHPDRLGRWSVRASGGIWAAPMDPVIVGELLANNGSIDVLRGFGTFTNWPATEGTGTPGLTLVSTAFQGPRSRRGALQIGHSLSGALNLQVGAVYRHTDLLPRRTDLNLLPQPAFHDQHNRPVYGTLRQQGAIVAAERGSNRRFNEYDVVSAFGVDGWSKYRGFNVGFETRLSDRFLLQGRYTRSTTEDNWLMARQGNPVSAVSPFPNDDASDWTEGVSDFDLPNRAVLGAELTLPVLGGLRVAGLYRYQSGYPFTPGFRDGVDVNGDGSLSNDPAYIDANIAGFDEVASRWSCLSDQAGQFAERNSCRAPAASFLDARVALTLFDANNRSAQLVVDGINLISSGAEDLDRALYLIDETQAVSTAGSVVTIPLRVNSQFGEPVQRVGAGRVLRVGLRVKF